VITGLLVILCCGVGYLGWQISQLIKVVVMRLDKLLRLEWKIEVPPPTVITQQVPGQHKFGIAKRDILPEEFVTIYKDGVPYHRCLRNSPDHLEAKQSQLLEVED
jgi:hypothetical protein